MKAVVLVALLGVSAVSAAYGGGHGSGGVVAGGALKHDAHGSVPHPVHAAGVVAGGAAHVAGAAVGATHGAAEHVAAKPVKSGYGR